MSQQYFFLSVEYQIIAQLGALLVMEAMDTEQTIDRGCKWILFDWTVVHNGCARGREAECRLDAYGLALEACTLTFHREQTGA